MQQVLRQIQEAVEPVLERSLTKRRRQEFLASAGPLFLCLTFIEDALRVLLRALRAHHTCLHECEVLGSWRLGERRAMGPAGSREVQAGWDAQL